MNSLASDIDHFISDDQFFLNQAGHHDRRLPKNGARTYQKRPQLSIANCDFVTDCRPVTRRYFTLRDWLCQVSNSRLDGQLKRFSDRLVAAVGLDEQEAAKVATSVAAEVRFLEPVARGQILAVSPVPLRDRLDELRAFQEWMELASKITGSAAVTRAQVITQNYVCFVYLGEACFRALRKASKPGSVTRRCCTYLTSNPVRAFRNSIAHSNWTYAPGFDALMFGARKGSDPNEALLRFDVATAELNFWQALSRGVAYAAYCSIEALEGRPQPVEP